MKTFLAVIALLSVSVSGWVALGKASSDEEFYRDIRPHHWSWNGVDLETVEQVFSKMKSTKNTRYPHGYIDTLVEFGPGNWTYEFEQLGDNFFAKAEKESKNGLNGVAAFYFNKAAGYYAMAKYPHMRGDINQDRTYKKNLNAVEKAWLSSGRPIERIQAEWKGKPVHALLYLPSKKTPVEGWPIVIGLNGLDVFKGEFFSLPEMLAQKGIAFLATDMAGTGTNNHFALKPDNNLMISRLMDHVIERKDIAGEKMGAIGVSFSGNTVSKLAFTEEKRLSAVVNVCGPIHQVFMIGPDDVKDILPMYVDGFKDRAFMKNASDVELADYLKGFSLVNQGFVGEGKKSTSTPMLNLNAKNDPVAPVSDMELINASSTHSSIIYSGKNDHCPQDRFSAMPQVVDFLESNISRKHAHLN